MSRCLSAPDATSWFNRELLYSTYVMFALCPLARASCDRIKKVERKFEIAAIILQVWVLTYSREREWTLGGCPLERNVC